MAGEEGGYGRGFFAFELHVVEGETALSCQVAGEKRSLNPPLDMTGRATPKEYIMRVDLRLRGNRISESLGHGYGACALHEGATGRRDVRRAPSYPAPASLLS